MKINSKLDIVDKNSLKVNRPHRCPFILDIFYITMKYLECAPAADGSYVCTCKNWSGRDRSVVKKPPHSSLKRNWIGVAEFIIKKGHPLRLRRWPQQLAVCFLCRARVRTSDFSFAARTFLDYIELIVLGYVKRIFFLSIAVSL